MDKLDAEEEASALEKQFAEVLTGLSSDEALGNFHAEYEKVLNALRQSHENERRLTSKVKVLNNEVISNGA